VNSIHTTGPAEVSATEFRQDIARILRDAEYGRPTVITRDRIPVAKVVHPDAANMPHPDLWQAAQEAHDALNSCDLSPHSRRILNILGTLLGAYYGYEERT
jgi:antitoxin (DNA-binding transcriptional repressor) of toxin-antitoxin stability system